MSVFNDFAFVGDFQMQFTTDRIKTCKRRVLCQHARSAQLWCDVLNDMRPIVGI